MRALVVVFGDLARSPRMQNHCLSLAKANFHVSVLATGGGPARDRAFDELEAHENINQLLMRDSPRFNRFLPTSLAYVLKTLWQCFQLIFQLCFLSLVNIVIVQNPPSIPTLPVMWLYCKLTRTPFIIDWHNYGYTILQLKHSKSSLLVRLYRAIELHFGRLADWGFSVSESMQVDLEKTFKIPYPISVLYDRPPRQFEPLSLRDKHDFFTHMRSQIPEFKTRDLVPTETKDDNLPGETRFTITDAFNKSVVKMKPERPALIMSSTSWTEDEDFDILLDALKRYDITMANKMLAGEFQLNEDESQEYQLPRLVCIITGKGPLKEHYRSKIGNYRFQHIEIVLPWLEARDYSKMVASCDLGISLHSSSSGVDLPMKVVDMFGGGVPVLAYNYPAIGELVKEDYYGLTFNDSGDLFNKLVLLLKDFHSDDGFSRNSHENGSPLARYRRNIKRQFLRVRWEENWRREVKSIIVKLATRNRQM